MAYYKKGNRLLNEEEYEKAINADWDRFIIITAIIFVGLIAYSYIPQDWSKSVRVTSMISLLSFVGAILYRFREIVRPIVMLSIALTLFVKLIIFLYK